jgi:drug/metabolite transporter (DMT)-like permease
MVAQKTLRPTVVSMYNYVQPIVASIVAVVIGMDTFGLVKSVAIVLVFLGVYVVTQSKSREQMEAYEKRNKD